MIDTAKLRADAEKATPGPWRWHKDWEAVNLPEHGDDLWDTPGGNVDVQPRKEDRDHIANCDPQTIIALLDEVERLRAENEKLRKP